MDNLETTPPEQSATFGFNNFKGTTPQDSPIQHSPSTKIKLSDTSQTKPIMSISNIIPEFLVDKITLMAYELEPHPTASIIKQLDKWNGWSLWYKYHLKSYYIQNIDKQLKRIYYQYYDMATTYLKSDEEALDKFIASPMYYRMSMKITEDIISNEEHILSIKCDNIQNGLNNENPDLHFIDVFIQDHLYNIDYNITWYKD